MARRPTVSDIARASGVSVATVDRVLNGRLPVREETARRVYDAANAIGYHAAALIRRRIEQELPQYRLGFILQRPDQPFYQAFARELDHVVNAAERFRGTADIVHLDTQTPTEIAARLRETASRCRAVGIVAIDHPAVTAAVAEAREKGVPVFSLLSDFAPGIRENYIGLNNRKVGRTAAWLIARTTGQPGTPGRPGTTTRPGTASRPGKVAVFIGSHRFHGQEMREIGFRSYFREYAPGLELVETVVNLEDGDIAHEATLDLFRRCPDLVGLYVGGGGMEGVIAALREEGMAGRIVAVCNELTADSRAALADDIVAMVIGTPLERLSRELVAQMVHTIENGPAETPGQIFLPFDIFVAENI
ncbi:LacI family DNA-binding transcriptional regulator [Mesorhizobium sp. L-8-3]|uniref:LacI family DNA-binding transcriptional regulator n=1 Tax=Mesorhizobium sp. L-8-3 TaxID=2744522 RepID=UPI0019266A60|nr:LacI family DNA-binding transcriptional regulator [Mesorhizobium sp. L-8-3]BCH22138.1 LacI family transcriptional regulator [Mesorhizobium sp. L-8-3]